MHVSKAELPAMVFGSYEGRTADSGGMRIAFESMPAHFPPDESVFKGLPDDRCQCDHWGYLLKAPSRSATSTARTRSCRPGTPTTCGPGTSYSRWSPSS
jgi:hypothetical protein